MGGAKGPIRTRYLTRAATPLLCQWHLKHQLNSTQITSDLRVGVVLFSRVLIILCVLCLVLDRKYIVSLPLTLHVDTM